MAVDGIGSSTANASSSLEKSRKSIAENFDTFLSLLTTQLKNQNPLDPLDTNQFTQQLVQFTSVEQQLKTNEFLEALVMGGQSAELAAINASNQAVSMIGKQVVASSNTAALKDGEASWTYTASGSAPKGTVTIRNQAGAIVYQNDNFEIKSGQHTFEWDGKDPSGLDMAEGSYSISFEATNSAGTKINFLTQVKGIVDTVDLTGEQPILMIDGARIQLGDILSVSAGGEQS